MPEIETTLGLRIQKFLLEYGAEQFIICLDDFEHIWHEQEYRKFKALEKEACKACGIPVAEMRNSSKTESTNAKRIVSFIAVNAIRLQVPIISKLLGSSTRSVGYYIKDVEDWITNPKSNRLFIESYNKVMQSYKIE